MPRKKTAVTKLQDFKSRRRSGRHAPRQDDVPEIYQDMLVEAAALSPLPLKREGRAAKRRRLEEPPLQAETPELESTSIGAPGDDLAPSSNSVPPVRALQTTYDDLASSDESDAAFEDVDLELPLPRVDADVENEKPLQLDFSRTSGQAETPSVQRRKPVTAAEKRLRLDVHKWHLLCLILHLHHRNRWCDNEEVQTILKPLIPRKLTALLHLDESKPQYARNHGFNKAIEEISDIWQREWTITAKGMRRAFWTEDADVVGDVSQKLLC
jgi:xeroderma pigmentosum group C-complementing protein